LPARRRRVFHRTSVNRAKMWDRKMSPAIVATYLESVKPMALERVQWYQAIHEHIISLVKDVLANYPYEAQIAQEYVWYASELWQLTQKYTSVALIIEADAVFLKYKYRGRNEDALREIARRLGIEISDWETILSRLGMSEEMVYRGTKKALQETLERVETDVTDAKFTYDEQGNLVQIIKTDKVTGRRKKITLEYDIEGNLVKKVEEWI